MVLTWEHIIIGHVNVRTCFLTGNIFFSYLKLDERISDLNLAKILFQDLNVANVVLVLNGQRDGLCV